MSESPERYTPEEAETEASKLQEKIEKGEAEDYASAERYVEREKRHEENTKDMRDFLRAVGEPVQAKTEKVVKTFRDDPNNEYGRATGDVIRPDYLLKEHANAIIFARRKEQNPEKYANTTSEFRFVDQERDALIKSMSDEEKQQVLDALTDEELLQRQQGRFFVVADNGVVLRLQKGNFRGEEYLFKIDEQLKFPVFEGKLFVDDEYNRRPDYSPQLDIRTYRDIIREHLGYELPTADEFEAGAYNENPPYRDIEKIQEAQDLLERMGYEVKPK